LVKVVFITAPDGRAVEVWCGLLFFQRSVLYLLESSITYRIAVGPQQGRKVFTLQTLPDKSDSLSSRIVSR
jgi:hypothetical protein